MGVNTTMLFDGTNTYEIQPGEMLWNVVIPVEDASHYTIQVMTKAISTETSGYIGIAWLNSKGIRISKTQNSLVVKTGAPLRFVFTFEVPAGAVKLQPYLKGGTAAYYAGRMKLEKGEHPSGFDTIDVNRVSKLDPNGLYTGSVWANQVILADSNGLDETLTSLRAGQLTLSTRMSGAEGTIANHSTQITNIKAGQINLLAGFDVSPTSLSKQVSGKYVDISSAVGADYIAAGLISGGVKSPQFRLLEDGSVYSSGDFTAGGGKLKYTKNTNNLTIEGEILTRVNGKKAIEMTGATIKLYDFAGASNPVKGGLQIGSWTQGPLAGDLNIHMYHEAGATLMFGYRDAQGIQPYVQFDNQMRAWPGYSTIFPKGVLAEALRATQHLIADGDVQVLAPNGVYHSLREFMNWVAVRVGGQPVY